MATEKQKYKIIYTETSTKEVIIEAENIDEVRDMFEVGDYDTDKIKSRDQYNDSEEILKIIKLIPKQNA